MAIYSAMVTVSLVVVPANVVLTVNVAPLYTLLAYEVSAALKPTVIRSSPSPETSPSIVLFKRMSYIRVE